MSMELGESQQIHFKTHTFGKPRFQVSAQSLFVYLPPPLPYTLFRGKLLNGKKEGFCYLKYPNNETF